jgi:hypothetical protein
VAGEFSHLVQRTVAMHLKRAAIPSRPLRLQSPLRRCWDWPGGAGNAVTFQENHHAKTDVLSSPPPSVGRENPATLIPPLWEQLTHGQRDQLARLVGQLLARQFQTADRREVNHDSH